MVPPTTSRSPSMTPARTPPLPSMANESILPQKRRSRDARSPSPKSDPTYASDSSRSPSPDDELPSESAHAGLSSEVFPASKRQITDPDQLSDRRAKISRWKPCERCTKKQVNCAPPPVESRAIKCIGCQHDSSKGACSTGRSVFGFGSYKYRVSASKGSQSRRGNAGTLKSEPSSSTRTPTVVLDSSSDSERGPAPRQGRAKRRDLISNSTLDEISKTTLDYTTMAREVESPVERGALASMAIASINRMLERDRQVDATVTQIREVVQDHLTVSAGAANSVVKGASAAMAMAMASIVRCVDRVKRTNS